MASFDRVIAISKTVETYIYENYEKHLKKPPMLIYRGSDESYFSPNFEPKQGYVDNFYKKMPSLLDKKILAFPGRLSSWKGQESFLEAINLVNIQLGYEAFQVVVLGNDQGRN